MANVERMWILIRREFKGFFLFGCLGLLGLGCATQQEGPFYSATSQAQIQPGKSFTEGKLLAIKLAENRARSQILTHIRDRQFSNGILLDEAIITDPFIQAKIYDTLRNAKITDKTINNEGIVTVTVQLDMAPVNEVLQNPEYAREVASRMAAGAPVGAKAADPAKP